MRGLVLITTAVAVVLCLVECSKKPTPELAPETRTASETAEIGDTESLREDVVNGERESADTANAATTPEEVLNMENWVPKYKWKGLKCKTYDTDDGYTTHFECFFPNAKLKQVFDIVKKDDVNIRTMLPETNLNDTCVSDGCNGVIFEYKSKKHLLINIGYDGGETYFEIIEKENGVVSINTYSMD